MNQVAIKTVKEFRMQVDGLMQLMIEHTSNHPSLTPHSHAQYVPGMSREVSDAYHSLRMAKAWMGKILEGLSADNPYPKDGQRNNVKDIEPTADVNPVIDAIIKAHPDVKYPLTKAFITLHNETNELEKKQKGLQYYSDLDYIQKIDWLREQMKKVTIAFLRMNPLPGVLIGKAISNVYSHMSEARFHLGFEFQRMREEHQAVVEA